MKEKEEEKLVTMVIRVPKYKKDMIKNIAKSQGRYEADIIRSGIDKELNLDLYQDKMEELIKEILKPIEEKMDKFLKSQRKITVKFLRTINFIKKHINLTILYIYVIIKLLFKNKYKKYLYKTIYLFLNSNLFLF